MTALGFTVADPPKDSLTNVSISVPEGGGPDKDGVLIDFEGISGNRPKTFKNWLALWDTTDPIIGVDEPRATAPVDLNLQPGSVHIDFTNFANADYLVTYQVGPSPQSMCATLKISTRLEAAAAEPPSSMQIDVDSVTTDSVTLFYNTIQGYQPKDYGNWIGIWQGFPNIYRTGDPPLGSTGFTNNSTQGLATIDGLNLDARFNYRVIYFLSGSENLTAGTDVAAALDFSVS